MERKVCEAVLSFTAGELNISQHSVLGFSTISIFHLII